jgi:Uma2 family endonuclease
MMTVVCPRVRILPHALRAHPVCLQRLSMPFVAPRRWTASDVRELPDEPGTRFECVDGELLVSPSPRLPHQSVVMLLWRVLEDYVRAHGIGAVFVAPGDLELDTHTLVQPDVYVLPLVNGRRPRTQTEIGQPLLFVEVLSSSTARFDRVVKRHRYQRQGVEYWIMDLDARLVERWLPDADRPSVHTDTITWQPAEAVSSLTVDVTPIFVDALGEP